MNKKTLRIIIGLIILSVSCFLAFYAQKGVDAYKQEPSILGFIVMWVVGITSAITLEKFARYLIGK